MNCLKIAALLVLLPCGAIAVEPAQLSADQTTVLESARTLAMQYTRLLPDFICTQITRRTIARSVDINGNIGAGMSGRSPLAAMAGSSGYLSDVIDEQLTYVGGKESYEVLNVNGRKVHNVVTAAASPWGARNSRLPRMSRVPSPQKSVFRVPSNR